MTYKLLRNSAGLGTFGVASLVIGALVRLPIDLAA